MTRPNILLLMSDQHNAKCLGCYGHESVRTPNLDRLAARGVRFTSAFAQNPICTPSRMCYLASQYAHNHGYYGLKGPLPVQLPSMFRASYINLDARVGNSSEVSTFGLDVL